MVRGHEKPDDARFCMKCGSPLETEQPAARRRPTRRCSRLSVFRSVGATAWVNEAQALFAASA